MANSSDFVPLVYPLATETHFTAEEQQMMSILITAASTLSFLGCTFVIISYVLFKEFRHFHMRVILNLILADLCTSIVAIVNSQTRQNSVSQPVFCEINAGVLQFSMFSSLLWTACIAHTLDQVIRKKNFSIEKYEVLYHLFSWGLPIGTVAFLWHNGNFGDATLWCWIDANKGEIYRFLFFYGPLGIIFMYNAGVYCQISFILYTENEKITREIEEKGEHTIQTTLRWFILAFFFCWLPAVANRIQNIFQPTEPLFWLYCLHASFTPLQGFFDAIIYGFNDELKRKYQKLFSKRFGCCSEVTSKSLSIQDEENWHRYYKDAMREYEEIQD